MGVDAFINRASVVGACVVVACCGAWALREARPAAVCARVAAAGCGWAGPAWRAVRSHVMCCNVVQSVANHVVACVANVQAADVRRGRAGARAWQVARAAAGHARAARAEQRGRAHQLGAGWPAPRQVGAWSCFFVAAYFSPPLLGPDELPDRRGGTAGPACWRDLSRKSAAFGALL